MKRLNDIFVAGRFYLLAILLLSSVLTFPSNAQTEFPEKPIHFIVYTGPGGLMDITTRKLVDIIREKHPEIEFTVENKKGAGGLVALSYLLGKPADGYYIMGLTSSVISKMLSVKQQAQLENINYLIRLVADYECLITRKDSDLNSLQDIKENANNTVNGQIWVGPDGGGTDHLFAQSVWQQLGITSKWIPYPSGGEAVAALMGGHGAVYVGNPQDVSGRDSLQIVAIAAPERLKSFPEIPTFRESGIPQLSEATLWRGFVVKKGTPEKVQQKLIALIEEASKDPAWKHFVKSANMITTDEKLEEFKQVVARQITSDQRFLR